MPEAYGGSDPKPDSFPAGLTLLPAAVSTLACSVLFLFAGNRLGRNPVLQLAGKGAEPISGGLLIGLGVMQFFL